MSSVESQKGINAVSLRTRRVLINPQIIFFSHGGSFSKSPIKKSPVSFFTGAIFVMTGATFFMYFFSIDLAYIPP